MVDRRIFFSRELFTTESSYEDLDQSSQSLLQDEVDEVDNNAGPSNRIAELERLLSAGYVNGNQRVANPDPVPPERLAGGSVNVGAEEETENVVPPAPEIEEPQAPPSSQKKRKRESYGANTSSLDESESCSICFESYTTNGKHRLCCLKCGHLFGQSCIERWITSNGRNPVCPQCKRRTNKKELRVLYSKGVKITDNGELESAKTELERTKADKRQLEMELAETKLKLTSQIEHVRNLQQQLAVVKTCLPSTSESSARCSASTSAAQQRSSRQTHGHTDRQTGAVQFQLLRSFDISKGESRVMDYCKSMAMLVCSSSTAPNPFLSGYGVKKISMADLRVSEFVPMHLGRIRDVKFSPDGDGILLSVGEDKFLKLTSLYTNNAVHTFELPAQGWCCAWKCGEPHYVFAGLQNGRVLLFDTRMLHLGVDDPYGSPPKPYVAEIVPGGPPLPVVSLAWVPCVSQGSRSSGLLVGQMNRVVFYEEKSPTEFQPHILPIPAEPDQEKAPGPLVSLHYSSSNNIFIASYRSRDKIPETHYICELTCRHCGGGAVYSCNVIYTFRSSLNSMPLNRSHYFASPLSNRGTYYAAAFDEPTAQVKIWDCSAGEFCQNLPMQAEKVRDICAASVDLSNSRKRTFLNVLAESKLHVFELMTGDS